MGTLTAHRDKLIIAECDIDTGAFCRNTDTWLGRTLTSSQRAHQKIKLKEIFFSLSLSPTCKHLSALSSWRIMDYGQSFKYVIGEDNDLPNADGIEKFIPESFRKMISCRPINWIFVWRWLALAGVGWHWLALAVNPTALDSRIIISSSIFSRMSFRLHRISEDENPSVSIRGDGVWSRIF